MSAARPQPGCSPLPTAHRVVSNRVSGFGEVLTSANRPELELRLLLPRARIRA